MMAPRNGRGHDPRQHRRRQHQADQLRVEALGLQPDREERQLDAHHHEHGGIKRRQARRKAGVERGNGPHLRRLGWPNQAGR
jgi:hypothetical protein